MDLSVMFQWNMNICCATYGLTSKGNAFLSYANVGNP